MPQKFEKDPDARLDYPIDWSDWLEGDTISTSTWEADSDDITIDDDQIVSDYTVVWLEDGIVNEDYRITNHIVTSAGREDDRTITIRVREK